MAAWMEMDIDEGMSGEEVLSLQGRFRSLHLPFSSSRRTMRVLTPIAQISASSALNVGKQVAPGAVATQVFGHDHPRHVLQALQQSLEKLLGSFSIPPVLHEDVEHDAFLIDRASEIVLHAPNPDEHVASGSPSTVTTMPSIVRSPA
jgi:hypothetical protein